jgi:hypothetical protein
MNSSDGFIFCFHFVSSCNNDVISVSFGRAAATVSGRSFADGDLRRHFLITAGDLVNSSSAAALPAALSLAVADELFNYTLQLRKGRPADICR